MVRNGDSLSNQCPITCDGGSSLKSNIEYAIVGGTKFYDRKEIKDILAYLRLIANPDDDISFQRVINVPKRGIGSSFC